MSNAQIDNVSVCILSASSVRTLAETFDFRFLSNKNFRLHRISFFTASMCSYFEINHLWFYIS